MFIDNSYIFSGMLAAGWRLSWEKLQAFLERPGEIWQTHFFATEHVPPKDNQRNFFNMLSYNLGYELHLSTTRQRHVKFETTDEVRTIFIDKGLDVQLVTLLLESGDMAAARKELERARAQWGDLRVFDELGLLVVADDRDAMDGALAAALERDPSNLQQYKSNMYNI